MKIPHTTHDDVLHSTISRLVHQIVLKGKLMSRGDRDTIEDHKFLQSISPPIYGKPIVIWNVGGGSLMNKVIHTANFYLQHYGLVLDIDITDVATKATFCINEKMELDPRGEKYFDITVPWACISLVVAPAPSLL